MRLRRCRTSVLVVDASVIAPALVDAGEFGAMASERLRGERLAAPDLLRLEVASVLRRHTASGAISSRRAKTAIDDLMDLPIVVFPSQALLPRVWALRANFTSYDACYVALAETLKCTLLTADRRMAAAPGAKCRIELLQA